MKASFRPRPPLYFATALAAMVVLAFLVPASSGFLPDPFRWAGVALILAGGALGLHGIHLFHRHDTPLRPGSESRRIIRGGAYRFTRNPIYLGMMVVTTGFALLLNHPFAFLPLPLFFLVLQGVIRFEERRLHDSFGEEYARYLRSVRRWL